MTFHITGLKAAHFAPLFSLSDQDLATRRAVRRVAEPGQGYPCRVGLRDAMPGEELILVNHVFQPADTPYFGVHAIYVARHSTDTDVVDEIPDQLRRRTLSLRGFDARGFIVDAVLTEGHGAEGAIENLFARPEVATIHAHFAAFGCFAAAIERT